MNMMSQEVRREELAVPDFVRDLKSDYAISGNEADSPAALAMPRASLLERRAWFRNLSLAGKIKAVFGTFFGVGLLMVLVLGLGLSELWTRYNSTARVQEALVAAGQLQSTAGELRYHSVRVLYDPSAELREQQRKGESALRAQVTKVAAAVAADAPELAPRVEAVREELASFEATFDRAGDLVRKGSQANAAAADISAQGNALIAECARLAADLAALAETKETTGIAYFFNMILILAGLALFGGVVLLLGLA
jgi:methyl-accepting chemotaxis protein